MLASDSCTEFDYPQGDPGAISGAATQLDAAAGVLEGAAGQVSGAASSVSSYWSGPAALAFGDATNRIRDGLHRLADYHREAATALDAYAKVLTAAQTAASQAAGNYSDAQIWYSATVNRLRYDPPTGPDAASQIQHISDGAANDLDRAYQNASRVATHATDDARNAARKCADQLSRLSEEIKDTALHKFLDMMGGPGTVFGALGVAMQGRSAASMWNTLRAMDTGDFAALEKLYPKQYADIIAEAVAKYGPDSMQALKAQYAFEESVAEEAFGGMSDAATGLNAVPAGKLAGALDILGKVGVVTAVAADVATFFDSRAKGSDKAVAGINLGGVAMAAMGNEAVGGFVGGLVGVDIAGSWVPVVGEVLVAGTAIYMGSVWIHDHWGEIEHWASDVGHGLATGYHAVVHAVEWTGDELDKGYHVAQQGIESANNWVVHNVPGAGLAEHVASDLDPLNW